MVIIQILVFEIWGDVKTPSENWPTGGTPFKEQLTDYGAYVDIVKRKILLK